MREGLLVKICIDLENNRPVRLDLRTHRRLRIMADQSDATVSDLALIGFRPPIGSLHEARASRQRSKQTTTQPLRESGEINLLIELAGKWMKPPRCPAWRLLKFSRPALNPLSLGRAGMGS
jgi:hypothetical protein